METDDRAISHVERQMAYRKYVPNRVALGIPMTAKGEGDWVSLPFVSILALSPKPETPEL